MLSNRDEYFLDQARMFAEISVERKKHGCVIVKNGNVVGTGWNKFRNDPDQVSPEHIKTDCSYHAEFIALRQAGTNAKGATLYVARVNKAGLDRNSKPCDNCNQVISQSQIKRVVFTETGEYEC
jgi:deoxycytidylate deaminase